MRFITDDKPGGPDENGGDVSKRWSGPASILAGAAALIVFILTLVAIYAGNPNRVILNEIDQLMSERKWIQAESLCQRRLAEYQLMEEESPSKGSPWVNEVNMSADLRLRLGINLSMLERYDQAREVLDEAMAMHPDDERIAINRALLEYRLENYEEALARLRVVADQAPHVPNVNYHIGRIYERWGQYDDALRAYRDELNISSSAGAWERYLILKRIRGATTTRSISAQ
jgi:tetratricopeptide (TPR) repeat protein